MLWTLLNTFDFLSSSDLLPRCLLLSPILCILAYDEVFSVALHVASSCWLWIECFCSMIFFYWGLEGLTLNAFGCLDTFLLLPIWFALNCLVMNFLRAWIYHWVCVWLPGVWFEWCWCLGRYDTWTCLGFIWFMLGFRQGEAWVWNEFSGFPDFSYLTVYA